MSERGGRGAQKLTDGGFSLSKAAAHVNKQTIAVGITMPASKLPGEKKINIHSKIKYKIKQNKIKLNEIQQNKMKLSKRK